MFHLSGENMVSLAYKPIDKFLNSSTRGLNMQSLDDDLLLRPFFKGEKLYGDDFSASEIAEWYAAEAEAYAALEANDEEEPKYYCHTLNWRHGFSKLPERSFKHALGLGSAYGEEFRPFANRLSKITILDPSERFVVEDIAGVPVDYRKPDVLGVISFDDATFDLMTCFGTLHHVPNVTFVLSEMGRTLAPGGYALIREPISSMGDWRHPRAGLTMHERGIPLHIMNAAIYNAGLHVISFSPCMLNPLARVMQKMTSTPIYNSVLGTELDALCSRMLKANCVYWRDTLVKRLAPSSGFWLCGKA